MRQLLLYQVTSLTLLLMSWCHVMDSAVHELWTRNSADYYNFMRQLDLNKNLHLSDDKVPNDCVTLFEHKGKFEQDLEWPPPRELPEYLLKEFSLNGIIDVEPYYVFEKTFNTGRAYNWTKHMINERIYRASNSCGGYKKHVCES